MPLRLLFAAIWSKNYLLFRNCQLHRQLRTVDYWRCHGASSQPKRTPICSDPDIFRCPAIDRRRLVVRLASPIFVGAHFDSGLSRFRQHIVANLRSGRDLDD